MIEMIYKKQNIDRI